MFGKKKEAKELTKVEKRVREMATADLLSWAEHAMFGIGRSLSDWQRGRDKAAIDEAELGAEALHIVVKELKARQQ